MTKHEKSHVFLIWPRNLVTVGSVEAEQFTHSQIGTRQSVAESTSRALCKTVVTTSFCIRSYNSFAPSPRVMFIMFANMHGMILQHAVSRILLWIQTITVYCFTFMLVLIKNVLRFLTLLSFLPSNLSWKGNALSHYKSSPWQPVKSPVSMRFHCKQTYTSNECTTTKLV